MDEVQRKCSRTDYLDLAKVLEKAVGFKRLNASVEGLHRGSETGTLRRVDINYTSEKDNKNSRS